MDRRDIGMLSGNVTTNVTNLVAHGIIKVDDPVAEIPEIVREMVKELIAVQEDLVKEFASEETSGNSRGGRSSGGSGRRGSDSRSSGSGRRTGGGGGSRPATVKQVNYALQLVGDDYSREELEEMSSADISAVIDEYK